MSDAIKPRVLMFVENVFPQDSRVRNEALTLATNGYSVTVVALRGHDQSASEVIDGIQVYRIPRLTLFKKLPGTKESVVLRLINRAQTLVGYVTEYAYFTTACLAMSVFVAVRHGFDVIHAHNPPDTLAMVGALHKVFGKKFVFDHHDLSPELYRSRYRNGSSGVVAGVLQLFETFSVRVADVVIATNESYRAIDMQRNGASEHDVFIVRNGPDLRRVRSTPPAPEMLSSGQLRLVYLGAMNPQDGVDYLLRALRSLRRDLGREDFMCVLIGDGDVKQEMEALNAELGLSDLVKFTGYIPDETVMQHLSAADICLDPNPSSPLNDVSTWIKVMEYMALGKPIVSFDLKETRTSARDAAVYVTPNNERKFAEAIALLMDDPIQRAKMGAFGRHRVETELNWDVSGRNLLNAYRYLLPMSTDQLSAGA
jgi:glycosyltransferase involved in cell wall biosynthesis